MVGIFTSLFDSSRFYWIIFFKICKYINGSNKWNELVKINHMSSQQKQAKDSHIFPCVKLEPVTPLSSNLLFITKTFLNLLYSMSYLPVLSYFLSKIYGFLSASAYMTILLYTALAWLAKNRVTWGNLLSTSIPSVSEL